MKLLNAKEEENTITQDDIEDIDNQLQVIFDAAKKKNIGLRKGFPRNNDTEKPIATKHLCNFEIKKNKSMPQI